MRILNDIKEVIDPLIGPYYIFFPQYWEQEKYEHLAEIAVAIQQS